MTEPVRAAWRVRGGREARVGEAGDARPSESRPRRGLAARRAVRVRALPLPCAAPGTEEGTFWNLLLRATWSKAGGVHGDEPQAAVLPGAGGESRDAARQTERSAPHRPPWENLRATELGCRVQGHWAAGEACGPHSPAESGRRVSPGASGNTFQCGSDGAERLRGGSECGRARVCA